MMAEGKQQWMVDENPQTLTDFVVEWAKMHTDWGDLVPDWVDTEPTALDAGDALAADIELQFRAKEFDVDAFVKLLADNVDWKTVGFELVSAQS